MLLSDKDLKKLAVDKKMITPFNPASCEGATINLTLDTQIKRLINSESIKIIDAIPSEHYETINLSEEDFYIGPRESILVQSYEYFRIPENKAAIIFERYSMKLLGLVVSPASYMNPGFEGRLSFLMTNNSLKKIQLIGGVKFCQLAIETLSTTAEIPYTKQDARYLGSREVQISKLHLDEEIKEFHNQNGLEQVSTTKAKNIGNYFISKLEKNASKYLEILNEKLVTKDNG